ncbi:hypothetical protein C479_02551 [Halovivax asiaticus JCM 14624]|uniref:Uncharacterized protein n=1 Tax=Halovivax asiaticus JCM 14624 TaxID=1227490 RepID=M0BVJ4_9EURY|nr:hypothetical protein [Halovivax asiaticus]ELZ13689.1 hypothetical protein C479_02551 [Halovivax asiaticus JCM 14624]
MSQSGLSTDDDEGPIDQVAAALDATWLLESARAVRACCGSIPARRYGNETAAAAAVIVASRRSDRRSIDRRSACDTLGLDPSEVAHAVELLEAKLAEPAPAAERRRLRQTLVAIDELLAAIEAGRTNPPRLAGPGFAAVDPRIRALAAQPLSAVDEDALRRDRRRFATDLSLARLGADLYVQLHVDPAD